MLLKTHNLSKSFGGLKAVHGINFELETGEVRGLIGPNGSGKSTFFNLISGVYKPDPGSRCWFDGDEITGLEPHDVARRGLARTFQLLRIFLEMTVLENLLVGHHTHVSYNVAAAVLGLGRVRAEDKRTTAEMMDLLSFIGLADYAEMPAADLSIGQRRLLALGRAMAMKPKLLMLDEPAAGLSPVNVDNLLRIIMSLKQRYGLTVIVVEHILKVVMETCQRVTVLDYGEKIAEGTPDEVKNDHAVIEAYLGREMDDEAVRQALHG
jgi:branched-chain amino acid transport system ATP-binding protein